ncbi:Kinesin-like protein, partial [Globisporangium splendens]
MQAIFPATVAGFGLLKERFGDCVATSNEAITLRRQTTFELGHRHNVSIPLAMRVPLQQVAQGFNCTVFAYGQTGMGKTHTMLGKDIEKCIDSLSSGTTPSIATSRYNWGMIPRSIECLFEELRSISCHGAAAIVYCSYMQIYKNEVYDLLQENKQRVEDPLAVREMIKGNGKQICVSGLSEFRVTNLDETLKLLKMGNRNRTIRATEYNEKSSRSHALLQLSAEVESRGVEGATTIIRRAKLNLVDLAGSEKWDTDVVVDNDRCKEFASINQNLSALGNVVSALTNPKRTHIPYRDSKLTRLLQDSLSGNTRTVVIATISPSETALDETTSTLMFPDRAKCVMVNVKANGLVDNAILLPRAQREITRLKILLKQSSSSQQVIELEEQVAKLTKANATLMNENKKLRKKLAALSQSQQAGGSEKLPTAPCGDSRGFVAGDTHQRDTNGRSNSPLLPERSVTNKTPSKRVSKHDSLSASSLRLNQLQLDLVGVNGDAAVPKPTVLAAFQDDEDTKQRLEGVEKEHERILREIQTERRQLEQKLEQLPQSTPRQSLEPATLNGVGEETCPMCGRNIDDHSDEALDICIEREIEMAKQQQARATVEVQGNRSGRNVDNEPTDRSVHQEPLEQKKEGPLVATIPPRTSADITPRRISTSAGGRPSPYLQDLGLKPETSSQSRPKSFMKRRSLQQDGSSLSGLGRRVLVENVTKSVNPAASKPTNGPHGAPATAEREDPQSNQVDSQTIPILRQGHKSVKALKKFHAMSPYNLRVKKSVSNDKKTSVPSSSTGSAGDNSDKGNNNAQSPESTKLNPDAISNSVRDIGLKLSVYKFRYDCWYPCTIVGFDGKRKLHCCQFEYGDKQWQDLRDRKVQVVGRSNPNDDSD